MPRIFALASLVLVLAATPAGAQSPPGDSVVGLAAESPPFIAEMDVHSGPAGENPTGTASWHSGGGLAPTLFADEITCLAVTGTTAVFGFSGRFRFVGEDSPSAGLVRVTDGGGVASGLDSFESAEVVGQLNGPPIPGPTDCSSYPGSFGPGSEVHFNRGSGDIVITDAVARPTSKDKCKNGGWKTYGIFKNQGDCVSFVATGGKNPPANSP